MKQRGIHPSRIRFSSFLRFSSLLALLLPALATAKLPYPAAPKGDTIDNFFGVKVADPYRWLEDLDGEETASWVAAENKVTFSYLEALPGRERIAKRLTELWNYPKRTVPYHVGRRWVFGQNDGLQNQDVLYTQETLADEPSPLLDPNTLSPDGTVALANLSFSNDGRYMMYGTSESGSDWQTLHVRDLSIGEDLPDELKWIKFSATAWIPDNAGFFYARFGKPKPGAAFEDENKNQKLFYHPIGVPQKEDQLVYALPDDPELGFDPFATEDGHYLILTVSKGTDPQVAVHYIDLATRPWRIVRLLNRFDAMYSFLGNIGFDFYFLTDQGAPNGRVVAISLDRPDPSSWREVVPAGDAILESGKIIAGRLVLRALADVKARLTVHDLNGTLLREIPLPAPGSLSVRGVRALDYMGKLSGRQDDTEMFYGFTSFTYPATIYRYDFAADRSEVYWAPNVAFDPSPYETRQVFYPSKDGTRIPMFIVCRKDLVLNGQNPTHIYAYGGFNINETPYFSVANVVWLEMGGVYAQPNLRGGGEYGEPWHEAGILEKKQNGIDDFIAAAEYLISAGYTNPKKLSIEGASNGGLMSGACLTQRPDLFAGVLVDVGVLDMLRYHKWTVGWAWASDYGRSDNPVQFPFLYKYSPLHNVKRGTEYPATLILTADHDDRVVPSHSFKFAATLQDAQKGDEPVLIRVDVKAGHGSDKPTAKRIEEQADCWAFLAKALGMEIKL